VRENRIGEAEKLEKVGASINKEALFSQIKVHNTLMNLVALLVITVFLGYFSVGFYYNFTAIKQISHSLD